MLIIAFIIYLQTAPESVIRWLSVLSFYLDIYKIIVLIGIFINHVLKIIQYYSNSSLLFTGQECAELRIPWENI